MHHVRRGNSMMNRIDQDFIGATDAVWIKLLGPAGLYTSLHRASGATNGKEWLGAVQGVKTRLLEIDQVANGELK